MIMTFDFALIAQRDAHLKKEIKYSAVIKMMNGNWDDICEDEILDVD